MPVDVAKTVSDGFLENVMIMDKNFVIVDILDTFESMYWIERYNKTGDFEIVIPIIEEHLPHIRINNYISIKESEIYMIIENVTLKTDEESGDMLTISGRTPESMLDRRIVWHKLEMRDSIQELIYTMIDQNAISPADSKRKLPVSFARSSDSLVTSPVEEVKLFGENVYEEISGLCAAHNVGIKSTPAQNGIFSIELYAGVDRSWAQTERIPVIFSHNYENLLESNYIQTEVDYVSNSLVRGDDDSVTMEVFRKSERTGISRREMFIDTNLQPETQEIKVPVLDENGQPVVNEDGTIQTETETIKIYDEAYYNAMLASAKIEMCQHNVTEAFDSSVDTTHQFFYGEDYNLGDIVQVENRYGFSGRCRITEIMRSRDASGPKLVPTFIMVDENGDEVTT